MATTIKDLAKMTGLSTATISKCINGIRVSEENKKIITECVAKTNYHQNGLAKGLKTKKSMTIGVLMPTFNDVFTINVVIAIENYLNLMGYNIICCDCGMNVSVEEIKTDLLLSRMVDGMIIFPVHNSTVGVKKTIEKGIPVVVIDQFLNDVNCNMVLVDNIGASYKVIEYLISNGHRNIGIICGPSYNHTSIERLEGYKKAHHAYNIPIDENNIIYGDYGTQSGYDGLKELWNKSNRPTAIFATNYYNTLGASIASKEMGLQIPDDFSLVAFDNLELARIVSPGLTVVMQPMEKMGETAARLLLKLINSAEELEPEVIRLSTEMIIRDSVANLNNLNLCIV